ncbi:MAG: redoxin domain-containing protein [Leptospiraceae bacterium]|nr:redoxin domain-containing protein [Leptospiraceae bacterium]
MIEKLKSITIVPLILSMFAISGFGIYQFITTLHSAWLALVLTQLPAVIYFSAQVTVKFQDSDPRFRILSTIVLAGPAAVLLQFGLTGPELLWQPLIASVGFCCAYLLFAYWIPRLSTPTISAQADIGQSFPVFVLDDESGNPVTSAEILTQPALFIFYRGNWCPLCMAQIKEVARSYNAISELGVRIVLVNNQSHAQTRKLASNYDVDFIYLVDQEFQLAEKLHIRHSNGAPKIIAAGYDNDTIHPTVVFTNQHGQIVYLKQTDNIRVRPEPAEFLRVIKQQKLQSHLEDKIAERTSELQAEKHKSDQLLFNILPRHTALELKENGHSIPRHYQTASILFTDFKDFTRIASQLAPGELIEELHEYFSAFDEIVMRNNMERIKTIGDAYMAAGGLPVKNHTNPYDAALAALQIRDAVQQINQRRAAEGRVIFELRIGVHTGQVVAGVIGKQRFAFDIWGDAVNLAARLESSGEAGRINISQATWDYIKDLFDGRYRGEIQVKNKGAVRMHYLENLKSGFSTRTGLAEVNPDFLHIYNRIKEGVQPDYESEVA